MAEAKKKTVWIATRGCYSAYTIIGVFSTKAAAQFVSNQYEGYSGGNEPQEYSIDELEGGSKKQVFWCEMDRATGKVTRIGVHDSYDVVPKNSRVEHAGSLSGPAPDHNTKISTGSYVSSEHAQKLAVEYRQKLLRQYGK